MKTNRSAISRSEPAKPTASIFRMFGNYFRSSVRKAARRAGTVKAAVSISVKRRAIWLDEIKPLRSFEQAACPP